MIEHECKCTCEGQRMYLETCWSCLRCCCCFRASSTPVKLLYALDRAWAFARLPLRPSLLCLLGGAASSTKCSLVVSGMPCNRPRNTCCSHINSSMSTNADSKAHRINQHQQHTELHNHGHCCTCSKQAAIVTEAVKACREAVVQIKIYSS